MNDECYSAFMNVFLTVSLSLRYSLFLVQYSLFDWDPNFQKE
jgi:hypothetical protein